LREFKESNFERERLITAFESLLHLWSSLAREETEVQQFRSDFSSVDCVQQNCTDKGFKRETLLSYLLAFLLYQILLVAKPILNHDSHY